MWKINRLLRLTAMVVSGACLSSCAFTTYTEHGLPTGESDKIEISFKKYDIEDASMDSLNNVKFVVIVNEVPINTMKKHSLSPFETLATNCADLCAYKFIYAPITHISVKYVKGQEVTKLKFRRIVFGIQIARSVITNERYTILVPSEEDVLTWQNWLRDNTEKAEARRVLPTDPIQKDKLRKLKTEGLHSSDDWFLH